MADDELVTGAEVARRLGVSRTWVSKKALGVGPDSGWPESLGMLGRSRVYRWADIEEWQRRTGWVKREFPQGAADQDGAQEPAQAVG